MSLLLDSAQSCVATWSFHSGFERCGGTEPCMASGCPNALASAKQPTNALMQPLFRRIFLNTGKFRPS
jgi:hypothetical protein